MLFVYTTPVLNRHLWQLKTVVFLHRCLICAVILHSKLQSDDCNGTACFEKCKLLLKYQISLFFIDICGILRQLFCRICAVLLHLRWKWDILVSPKRLVGSGQDRKIRTVKSLTSVQSLKTMTSTFFAFAFAL
jgi:hypothetical protein